MPWQPMKQRERWSPEESSRETIIESTPVPNVMPRPRPSQVTWIDKEKAGARRIGLWMAVYIFGATFVAISVGLGFIGARFYTVALIIFGGGQ